MTQRYLRHFNLVSITPFDDESLYCIFESILGWWSRVCRMSETLASQRGPLVNASIEMYRTVLEGLLPTPAKSHYTFNLRDLSKVIGGVESSHHVDDFSELVRLWAHENLRIYSDRLINDEDRAWFSDKLQDLVPKYFRMEFNKLFAMPAVVKTEGKKPTAKEKKEQDRALANQVTPSRPHLDPL